jgi:membrane fusion protein, protease secretion system
MKFDPIGAFAQIYAWVNHKLKRFSAWGERSHMQESAVPKDVWYFTKLGWKLLLIGFGGFMLWASFAPLDKGVTASGFVITDGQRKVIQPTASGILDDIVVKEGEHVEAGQVLVVMNNTSAHAQLIATRENVIKLEAQVDLLGRSIESRKKQLGILRQQLANAKELAKEGYLAKNRVLDLEQSTSQLESAIALDQASLEERQRQLSEQRARIAPHELELLRTEIKSPVSGYVVNLQFFTSGGVVQAGQKLMEITPDNQPLIVEAKLPIHLIDKVHEGQPVEMMFTAFNQNRTPHIPGVLMVVGDDRIIDERPSDPKLQSYYRMQIEVTPQGERMLGEHKVRAGMPVDVFVKTGERSLLSYMLKPIFDRAHSALREE